MTSKQNEYTQQILNKEISGIKRKIKRITKRISNIKRISTAPCGTNIRSSEQTVKTIVGKSKALEREINILAMELEKTQRLIDYQNNRCRQANTIIKRGF
jgi:chromosome segregation ATPase